MIKYKRIILKVSGAAFADDSAKGICNASIAKLVAEIKSVYDLGVEIGVVVGGGNFWRGRLSENMDRGTADYIGMLATCMNALALGTALSDAGIKNKVVTSLAMDKIAETYMLPNVLNYLDSGNVVVFGGGTGCPYFSTDTTATLRALEVHADAVICSKNVDGVYDSDPVVNADAKKYDTLTFAEVLEKNLKVMDLTATAMCREYGLPLILYSKDRENGLLDAACGNKIGTTIT
jgi:uridylate kinase